MVHISFKIEQEYDYLSTAFTLQIKSTIPKTANRLVEHILSFYGCIMF